MTAQNLTTVRAQVARVQDVTVEWNASANRLRIADPATKETLAVFSGDEVYKVAAKAPAGSILITDTESLPSIARVLATAGVIKITNERYDPVFKQITVTARVLIR
ncbi:hypothetical protein SAMN06295974_3743 [Plantibacter flavus]|uniref:Uncharacterized protein n=1 Tax=Plantibacter flavus TaxID=150123 RepID=A0A3N2BLH7_9MICO|nr:hypothetical protein [Plantibacter flavus]ROR76109.1 hypothetical protein EDD42_4062 [Plantibacter flavus]SMG48509.1 hypothetical protein SAMN06295974_3743 [Plantibacter flavus]